MCYHVWIAQNCACALSLFRPKRTLVNLVICCGFTSWQLISACRWVLTCDSAHSWWLHSAAPLGDQVASTMTSFHSITLSWYWANQSMPYPFIVDARVGSNKFQFCKSLVWMTRFRISDMGSLYSTDSGHCCYYLSIVQNCVNVLSNILK